ncbi:hypothetical protein V8E53_010514 [Lactarius tabidus]
MTVLSQVECAIAVFLICAVVSCSQLWSTMPTPMLLPLRTGILVSKPSVSTRCYHYKPFDNLESGDIVFPTVMDCVAVVWVALWLPCGPRCLRHNAPPGCTEDRLMSSNIGFLLQLVMCGQASEELTSRC